MSVRAGIGALLFGPVVLLGAAEARAAPVCSNTPGANDRIYCTQGGSSAIDIDLSNPAISTTGNGEWGIWAEHTGAGDIDIDVTGGSVTTADAPAIRTRHEGTGAIAIDLRRVTVSTAGGNDNGVAGQHRGAGGTGVAIDITGGSIETMGSFASGVSGNVNVATGASVAIDLTDAAVSTANSSAYGVIGWIGNTASTASASVSIGVTRGSIATEGASAHAIWGYVNHISSMAALSVVVEGATVSTGGAVAHGFYVLQNGLGGLTVELTDTIVRTTNSPAYGVFGRLSGPAAGAKPLIVNVTGGSVTTGNASSHGILGFVDRSTSPAALSMKADGVVVTTESDGSHGVFALHDGMGAVAIDPENADVTAEGDGSVGVVGYIRSVASMAALSIGPKRDAIDTAGGSVLMEGLNARGAMFGRHAGLGSVDMRTGADMTVEAPFAAGIETWATNDENATGRLVIEHAGAVEARNAGLVAWAQRSSGHTMGAGAQTADDAARTAPMIHVTSSGTIAVGDPVTGAFIRSRIAGDDETLSDAERAVLDAISAEDSDALDTALAALDGDDYDAAWKAAARTLLRRRIDAPDAAAAANRAAAEILGLSRAGVRASALSRTAIAEYIRQGDRDPAILVIAEVSRTPQQQAALAEQEKLSAAERTVLQAVLTGSGLDAALDDPALTAAAGYDNDWKNMVRQHAARYNAGDIRVDVTGGSIVSDGNGVEAFYAVPHDSNGAIAVTVAAGASVVGGANGVFVRGASAHTVTVNGAVTGGTGAGVLGAGGDLTATVSGTVTGDIRVDGGGALTANIMAGGVVTGTIHNPAALAIAGRVGRILYDNGGTMTVAKDGAVTGVEIDGATETIRAIAGDLDITVAGRIEGGLRPSDGGTLTATVMAGGVVTGTLRNPQTPLTVSGRVGRVLYDNGGTMTVAAGGAVTGLEIEGTREAIRSDAGDLDVTVAANGEVTGLVEGRGAGNLDVTVSGTVTGGIAKRGAGDLDVTVSGAIAGGVRGEGAGAHKVAVESSGAIAGTVRLPANAAATIAGKVGRVHYDNGGAVTVNASGDIAGLEIEGVREAIRSAAGDLTVAVHGTVTGNIEALGDGDLTVTVSETGTVAGEIFGRGGGVHTVEIADKGAVLGTVHNPKSGTTVHGAAGRVLFDNGGALTIAATGRIAGVGGEAIRADAGDLDVTVASGGMVTGRIEGRGAGAMTVNVTGAVTGAIHGKGAGKHEVTVASGGIVTGDIVDMDAGGLVASVAGRLAGSIEERGAGDLTATVTGTVTGGIRGMGAGSHTVSVPAGGSVAGTVQLPTSAMTIAGRVGSVLYDDGGSVTVARGGAVTGVEGEAADAIRSAAGDLSVTVAGRVAGGIRALGGGKLTLETAAGGVVTGTVRNPGSPMTVRGSVGRILYDNGGSVTVAAGGAITGVDNEGTPEAIRSAAGDLTVDVAAMATVTGAIRGEGDGDLDVDVSGTVKSGIFGLGGGEHDVHVKSGGAVEGLIHLAASAVTVDGSAGGVRFESGGTVAVGAEGRIAGLDGRAVHSAAGDLTVEVNGVVTGSVSDTGAGNLEVTVANALTGGVIGGGGGVHRLTVRPSAVFKGNVAGVEFIRVAGRAEGTLDVPVGGEVEVPAGGELVGAEDAQGRRVAVIAETGALNLNVDGRAEGAVEARDRGAASMVTIGPDGAIDGRIALAGAGSAVGVNGAAQSIDITRGMVTIGENGRIEDETSGEGAMTIKAAADEPDESVAARVGRVGRGIEVCLQRVGEDEICLDVDADGRLAFDRGPAPRHRVYEALPSVLLALNALPAHGDRLASAGAPRGAFARIDAGGGERRPASSTAQARHEYRSLGFETGMEGAVGESGVFAFSMHHVRGRADVETDGGRVDVAGTGARMAGAWLPAQGFYVSAQAAATLYEADLDSALAGALASDISGHGYAVGAEIGRRLDLGRVALTPRAGAAWSQVEMSSFTDAMDERIALDAGRRITARAGLRADADTVPGGAGGVFATVDVERELSGAMEMTAADRQLEAEAEATWLHLGLGGAHEWGGGRFALRAAANYAAAPNGNRDFAGNATLTVRF